MSGQTFNQSKRDSHIAVAFFYMRKGIGQVVIALNYYKQ